MEAILFALVAHVGWGTSGIFGATAARKMGGFSTTFWSYLIRIPFLALIIPFDLVHVRALTLNNILLSGGLAVVLLIGSACSYEAFHGSNASVVGTIAAAFVVPTIILSVFFFDETLDLSKTLAITVIVIGIVVTMLDFASLRGQQQGAILDRGVMMALLAMIFWGVYFAFIRIPVEEIGWFLPAYIGYFFTPVLLLIMRWRGVRLQFPTHNHALPSFVGTLILSTTANLSYNLGISKGYTSTVAPIAGSYPLLFVLLSALVFKEPLKKQQMAGIAISLVGIVFLSFLS